MCVCEFRRPIPLSSGRQNTRQRKWNNGCMITHVTSTLCASQASSRDCLFIWFDLVHHWYLHTKEAPGLWPQATALPFILSLEDPSNVQLQPVSSFIMQKLKSSARKRELRQQRQDVIKVWIIICIYAQSGQARNTPQEHLHKFPRSVRLWLNSTEMCVLHLCAVIPSRSIFFFSPHTRSYCLFSPFPPRLWSPSPLFCPPSLNARVCIRLSSGLFCPFQRVLVIINPLPFILPPLHAGVTVQMRQININARSESPAGRDAYLPELLF